MGRQAHTVIKSNQKLQQAKIMRVQCSQVELRSRYRSLSSSRQHYPPSFHPQTNGARPRARSIGSHSCYPFVLLFYVLDGSNKIIYRFRH